MEILNTNMEKMDAYLRDFNIHVQLSPAEIPILTVTFYVFMVHFLQNVMKFKKPFGLKWLVIVHNIFLTIVSTIMTAGFVISGVKYMMRENKAYETVGEAIVCDCEHEFYHEISPWIRLFYVSKYYELFDTLFLVLKKKPVMFLHEIHHVLTLLIAYSGLRTEYTVMWIACLVNSVIHVAMYYYYAVTLMGVKVWWKKYLTKLQITQFCGNVAGLWVWLYYEWTRKENEKQCAGEMWVWISVHSVMIIFLVLFGQFYRASYNKKKQGNKNKSQ